jgi:hypothetical protein
MSSTEALNMLKTLEAKYPALAELTQMLSLQYKEK